MNISELSKRPFIRNVAAVATGAAASQAIAMAFAPLITRLYGPEVYGIQGVFMAIAGILGTISALTYPIAIVLPRRETDAVGLARLSLAIGLGMSFLATVIIIFWGYEILFFFQAEMISAYIYYIPVFMLISVISLVVDQWLVRKKAFTLTTKVKVWQTLLISTIKAGVGFVHPIVAVLIITNILGGLFGAILRLWGLRKLRTVNYKEENVSEHNSNIYKLANEYRDFPKFRAPQELLKSLSSNLPILMLAANYGSASVGFYSLASAILGIPIILVGSAVMQVFYPRITEAIHHKEDASILIKKAMLGMGLSGGPVFVTVIVGGPLLFGFIFGDEWQMAGIYAQWLSISVFFHYISIPAVSAITSLRLQRGLLIYELFSTCSQALALYLGYTVFGSDIVAVALFSICGAVAYVLLILWAISHSKKKMTKT